MRILIIEPFNGGSHAAWAQGYRRHSAHEIDILGLPGENWKWRMQGAAVTLARHYLELVGKGKDYDLVITSDMLDLATFLGLIRKSLTAAKMSRDLKIALYFHENQLTYPLSPNEKSKPAGRDRHFGLINFTSALAADVCFFNSDFHRRNFLAALPQFLQRFPDYQEIDSVAEIEQKSAVLHLGLELQQLAEFKPESKPVATQYDTASARLPLILWNHRWEYDKNPAEFFKLLEELVADNFYFEVAILGEHFDPPPELFCKNRELLGDRLKHFGYVENFADYAAWLWRADLLPVTSHHDFFGISVVEAVYCDCYHLLPDRLAYPEHFPAAVKDNFFYSDYPDLLQKLKYQLDFITRTRQESPGSLVAPGSFVAKYDWSRMAPEYDARMRSLLMKT
jgi:glycosyltransferase involved in cell wall biosynthesis